MVSLAQECCRHLSGGTVTHEWVIVQAFQFLLFLLSSCLRRLANTEIREALDLADVAAQFDDFESDVARRPGRRLP